jgi:hypothetical protein
MITLKDFMECVDYKISDGSEYLWTCFGPNARSMEYWNGEHTDSITICCVFDTEDQTVYEMQAWDGRNNREYRWIHPDYVEAHKAEAKNRNVDFEQSFDDNKFIDLDVAEDMLDKASAIMYGEEYDTRIIVSLDMTASEKLMLMEMAHAADMSVNQYVEMILQAEIDRRSED